MPVPKNCVIFIGCIFKSRASQVGLHKQIKDTASAKNLKGKAGVLSGADIQKSRSSGIVMLAGKYGILDKKLAGN